jgi:hypothetical protein
MSIQNSRPPRWFLIVFIALLAPAVAWAAGPVPRAARAGFKAAKMIIEYNSSAEDVGVQFFLDSESWQTVKIYDPRGTLIFNGSASGSLLAQGGGTEMFVESVEPGLDELSLGEFLDRFPEGQYRFVGRSADGAKMTSRATFSHDVPAGPEVTSPPQPGNGTCPQGVSVPAVIAWNPVTEDIEGEPIEIVGYEVIVEHDELVFDIRLPSDATQVTVPAEFLAPGTDYIFEVLAIEEGGNQTITEGCFDTAR